MQKLKKNKGITLIALVVTIIVLIILASIGIKELLGENGILKKAKKEQSGLERNLAFSESEMESLIEEQGEEQVARVKNYEELKEVLSRNLPNNFIIIVEGRIECPETLNITDDVITIVLNENIVGAEGVTPFKLTNATLSLKANSNTEYQIIGGRGKNGAQSVYVAEYHDPAGNYSISAHWSCGGSSSGCQSTTTSDYPHTSYEYAGGDSSVNPCPHGLSNYWIKCSKCTVEARRCSHRVFLSKLSM